MASIAGYFLATTWKFSNPSNGSGDGNREQILLVGDSLTQRGFDSKKGWVSKLASTYVDASFETHPFLESNPRCVNESPTSRICSLFPSPLPFDGLENFQVVAKKYPAIDAIAAKTKPPKRLKCFRLVDLAVVVVRNAVGGRSAIFERAWGRARFCGDDDVIERISVQKN